MNIIDILILLIILLFGVVGFQRGFFKQTVIFVGELLVLVFAFLLKNPIGCLKYFFNISTMVSDPAVLNPVL